MAENKLQVVVSELVFEVKGAQEALDTINAKFGQTTQNARTQRDAIAALVQEEEKLLKARAAASSPNTVAKYDEALKQVRATLNNIRGDLNQAAAGGNKVGAALQKTAADASKANSTIKQAFQKATFDSARAAVGKVGDEIEKVGKKGKEVKDNLPGAKPIKIKFDGDPIKFLKELGDAGVPVAQQIRRLQNELIAMGETHPNFQATKEALAELKDEFGDFKDDINANVGEPLERIQGNFQNLAQSLFTLDFKQANKALGGLAGGIRALKFSDVIGGIKGLGKNLLDLGKAIITNPIFLLATVIILVIVNFEKLKKSGGIIGDLFKGIGAIIGAVVDAFKFLSDAIGFTNFALEAQKEALELSVAAYDKLIEKQREMAQQQEALFEASERLRISQIKDEKERTAALLKLEEDLYLVKLNNRAKDTENLKAQLAKQQELFNKTVKPEVETFLNDKNVSIGSITDGRTHLFDLADPKLEGLKLTEEAQKVADKLDEINKQINNNLAQDQLDALAILTKSNEEQRAEEERQRKAREEAQKRWLEYWKARTRIFEEEAKKLRQAIIDNRLFDIDNDLTGLEQVRARFAVQREEIIHTAEEDKKAAKEILNKADYRLFEVEVAKRVSVQLILNAKQQAKEELEVARKLADEKAELRKKSDELDLELDAATTLGIIDQYDQKFKVVQDYYDAKVAAALAAGKTEEAMLLSREGDVALAKLRKERLLAIIAANKAELDEEERHALAMMQIEGASEAEILNAEIEFEKERLRQLEDSNIATELEIEQQQNKIIELEAKKNAILKDMDEERVKAVIEGLHTITNEVISGTNAILQSQIDGIDKLRDAQLRRIEDARDIASTGNAELLELEQKRLDDLNKQKEKFVRAQQALAVVELIANSAVAISKAAAEGGAAAPFTIAATLIALLAGLAQARTIASQAAFYSGGLYDGQGYTGNGDPRQVSRRVGDKPYTYHMQEFIFNHGTTAKNRDIFEGVHHGRINLRDWERKAAAYDKLMGMSPMQMGRAYMMPGGAGPGIPQAQLDMLGEKLDKVNNTLAGQERLSVNLTERGLAIVATKYMGKMARVKKLTQ